MQVFLIAAEDRLPTVEELLAEPFKNKDDFVVLNDVLYQVRDTDQDEKWREGDQRIASIRHSENLAKWWYHHVNDAEKELVIGWLVRHGLMEDPEKLDFRIRLDRARKGGWKVPDWMYVDARREGNSVQSKPITPS